MLNKIIKFFLENKLVTFIFLILFVVWGIISSPFGRNTFLPSDPVPVDAIPDIGENQQIVYTEWQGRSPRDIEDRISYPLTTALMGIPGVKTVRSNSIFGLSSIYIIFEDGIDFYKSRTRILEKLNSLQPGILPDDVKPALGPDATALGQIFWYTLEGRDKKGNPAGGWDPQELRTLQDFYVRYGLTSAKGVSEVASIGGFVKEYQIDIDPNAMKAYGVNVAQIMNAVKNSNLDIGARTIEYNRVEYLVRALGYVKNLSDLEESVVKENDDTPVRLKDVAKISFGPATRRGGLDKDGSEAVGGVVVARYGANPMEVIKNLKEKIKEVSPGLPSKTLADGTVSKVTIIPFYDRTGLIKETLGTLDEALSLEILISIIVVLILVMNLRASFLISSLLPLGVLMTFIIMRRFGVDANIVALSGIAIAIGVMVDVGIVFTENIIRHLEKAENIGVRGKQLVKVIYEGTTEVAGAVITALATTVISFLPIFTMQAAEGKLFHPLAFTKTFAMISALIVGFMFIPLLANLIFSVKPSKAIKKYLTNGVLIIAGIVLIFVAKSVIASAFILIGVNNLFFFRQSEKRKRYTNFINIFITLSIVIFYLTRKWMPLGAQNSLFVNYVFVVLVIGTVLGVLMFVVRYYSKILDWSLEHKKTFLAIPVFVILAGILSWQGVNKIFGFMPKFVTNTKTWNSLAEIFPGTGKEFMPSLDEGSFLLMPTTMPHSGVEENLDVIKLLDRRVGSIPEVENVVGKWGRVNSALDPAPISMFENIINYKSEYIVNEDGLKLRFKTNKEGAYILQSGETYNPNKDTFRIIKKTELIPDENGEYFRQWRPEIKSTDDIWNRIVSKSNIPGLTSAPKLQPIQTRLVMLQTGMRAPMGIKVFGPDLETIEKTALEIESQLKHVKGVKPSSVFADRVVGKPYIELKIKRKEIARYGLTIKDVQTALSTAIGGMPLTSTVEGREHFPVRVRYAREFRDTPEDMKHILIPIKNGKQVPLNELVEIYYTRGPQLIKSENTFLTAYVIFDKKEGFAEVNVVENAQKYLDDKIEKGELIIPAGVNYKFTGNYENQVRANKRLLLAVPISLILIFLILYFQFREVQLSLMIFSGIFVAFAGGFIMIWLYGQPWFMNFGFAGVNIRELFNMHIINLSVAVWVGFIALFGIATDDGVIVGTYLKQVFKRNQPKTVSEVRASILEAGSKRVRPAMMTAATAIIALIPVLTSAGKGSDIMIPMAIPVFGGMIIQLMTMFVVPVLYGMRQEQKIKNNKKING